MMQHVVWRKVFGVYMSLNVAVLCHLSGRKQKMRFRIFFPWVTQKTHSGR